jgi:hypothetical protein
MRASALLLLTACDVLKPSSDVTAACETKTYGYTAPTASAQEALEQTNCYRNLMGLSRGKLNAQLDDAAQAHADYMYGLGTITHQESSSEDGFTGEWVDDRMEAAGYSLEYGTMFSEVVAYGYGPAQSIDGWVGTVYHRVPFTMPTWLEQGFGQTDLFSSMSFVTPIPDGEHQAVIFPADGQTDVPIDFDSDSEIPDPAPSHGVIGYPITVTVGAPDYSGDEYYNPYDLSLVDAVVWGPGGEEIDILTMDPTTDDLIYVMAAVMPIDPLEEGATYEAEITVKWDGDTETLYTEFTTGFVEEY